MRALLNKSRLHHEHSKSGRLACNQRVAAKRSTAVHIRGTSCDNQCMISNICEERGRTARQAMRGLLSQRPTRGAREWGHSQRDAMPSHCLRCRGAVTPSSRTRWTRNRYAIREAGPRHCRTADCNHRTELKGANTARPGSACNGRHKCEESAGAT